MEVPYTFDTAQVVRGLLRVSEEVPEVKSSIVRACEFMFKNISSSGEISTPSYDMWSLPGGEFLSAYCNLYCLTPLLAAGKKYNIPRFVDAATKSLNYYKSQPDIAEFKPKLGTLSHIFGYMMEALADLGEPELAAKGLAQARRIQKPDGAIPAYPGVDWVCATGMAQLGLAWYKIGNHDQAKAILEYLELIQNPSGGFYGGYGKDVQYFAQKEISWANKFFIDLYLLVRGKDNG